MEYNRRAELVVQDLVPFGQKSEREFYALSLKLPKSNESTQWAKSYKAGQFVMLKPKDSHLTWARPFSICRMTNNSLVLFFQVVGRGTAEIAKLKSGDKVIIWGPLGTFFQVEEKPTLMLAGGIGIAPFAGYLESHPKQNLLSMIFAHRLPLQCYPTEYFTDHIAFKNIQEFSATDVNKTLKLISLAMQEIKEQDGLVLACGPMPFLKAIWNFSLEHKIKTQLSLEEKMACGIGACLGCVAKTSENYPDTDKAGLPVQTCIRGPVFWADELDLSDQ